MGQDFDRLLYVTQGQLIQKCSEFHERKGDGEEVFYNDGDVVLLDNLVPDAPDHGQNANIFCGGNKTCSVIAIEVGKLRNLVSNDEKKLMTLWKKLAPKYIVLHKHYHFPLPNADI